MAAPRYSVLGLAKSGIAAANALAARGFDVLASDTRSERELAEHIGRLDPKVEVSTGMNVIRPGDIVVASPGIKPSAPILAEARRLGTELIGEIALFHRLKPPRVPVLSVTGTDGKSTTTVWLGEMVRASGRPVWVGGNLGTPLCQALDTLTDEHVVVAEISCFQLSTSPEFKTIACTVTNLAEDHLDYYGSFEAYVAAKRLLLAALGPGDTAVLNADDPLLAEWAAPPGAKTVRFSRRQPVTEGLHLDGDGAIVWVRSGHTTRLAHPTELRIPGAHNVENAMAAAGVALSFGIPIDAVRTALRSFGGLEHRIEFVRELDGVRYFNDSKATNPHASEAALTAFPGERLVLLAGGSEKGSTFEGRWVALVAANAAQVVCYGQTGPRISAALGDRVPTTRCETLAQALEHARALAATKGVVVLSPACASYDQFQHYEDRGWQFKAMVHALASASVEPAA